MRILEKKVNALMQLCTAEKESDRRRAQEEVRRLLYIVRADTASTDPEYVIRQILLELGAPDHLVGHPYVVQAVLLVVEDQMYINNITFGLYPKLAERFDTSASRVERGIRHLVEVTWTRGNWDALNHYFGNTVNPDRGKPTNGEFVARLANVVRQKMREAA